jgi:hypothetical protein
LTAQGSPRSTRSTSRIARDRTSVRSHVRASRVRANIRRSALISQPRPDPSDMRGYRLTTRRRSVATFCSRVTSERGSFLSDRSTVVAIVRPPRFQRYPLAVPPPSARLGSPRKARLFGYRHGRPGAANRYRRRRYRARRPTDGVGAGATDLAMSTTGLRHRLETFSCEVRGFLYCPYALMVTGERAPARDRRRCTRRSGRGEGSWQLRRSSVSSASTSRHRGCRGSHCRAVLTVEVRLLEKGW